MKKKAVIIILIVVLLGVGAFIAFRGSKSDNKTNQESATQSEETPAHATITYTDNGFEPAETTIKAGETVKIVNNSNKQLQFASDVHPQHTDNTELNVGVIAKGDSRIVTVKRAGTWGVHNHLNPSDEAKIIVQ